MEKPLTPEEARVLGCLIEKEMTTPLSYPLSLNGLVLACNQRSNREPVVDYNEVTVTRAIDGLRERGVVETVFPGESRVAKYRHHARYHFGLNAPLQALLGVLLLRGAQTAGELRVRTERMARFDRLEDVASALEELRTREEGALVALLPSRPGQKERRYAHLLCGEPAMGGDSAGEPAPKSSVGLVTRLDELEARIAHLEERVTRLESGVFHEP